MNDPFFEETLQQFYLRLPRNIFLEKGYPGSDLAKLNELCARKPWMRNAKQWQSAVEWLFGTLEILISATAIGTVTEPRLDLLASVCRQLPNSDPSWRLGLVRNFLERARAEIATSVESDWERSAFLAIEFCEIVQEFEESAAGTGFLTWCKKNFSELKDEPLLDSKVLVSFYAQEEMILSGAVHLSMVLARCHARLLDFRSNRALMSACWAFNADSIFHAAILRGLIALREASPGSVMLPGDGPAEIIELPTESAPPEYEALFNTGLWRGNREKCDLRKIQVDIFNYVPPRIRGDEQFNTDSYDKSSRWNSLPLYRANWETVDLSAREEIIKKITPALGKYRELTHYFDTRVSISNRIRVHNPSFLPNSYLAEVSLESELDQRSVIALISGFDIVHVDGTAEALEKILSLGLALNCSEHLEEYIRFVCSGVQVKRKEIIIVDDPSSFSDEKNYVGQSDRRKPFQDADNKFGSWKWDINVIHGRDLFAARIIVELGSRDVRVLRGESFGELESTYGRRFEEGVWITPEKTLVPALASYV
ncbi:hypothetical protein AB4Y32_39195 [Paraburkholderia phymatum]|uniref:Uncharacterized protein n=1 Tax=Paraburkholderia phymatum TaxID=148447 RepID=A0ACC6UDN4_9BURK